MASLDGAEAETYFEASKLLTCIGGIAESNASLMKIQFMKSELAGFTCIIYSAKYLPQMGGQNYICLIGYKSLELS